MAVANFTDIVNKCVDLKSMYSTRRTNFDAVEKMYLMDWSTDKPDSPWLKITISPSARNAVLGMVRILTSSDPTFSVPYDKNDLQAQQVADRIEKACSSIWQMAGRVRQMPIHYEMAMSGCLYGECHLGIISTADLVANASGASPAAIKRMEAIAARTPYLFDVYDPRTCYPEFDSFGLSSWYRESVVKSGAILDQWGKKAVAAGLSALSRNEDYTYCDYLDNDVHATWIDGKSEPLLLESHNLPCIPVVAQITEGSYLFKKPEDQRQPPLLAEYKSGIWNRQNLWLTTVFSNLFAIAANPTFLATVKDKAEDILSDFSIPGGVTKMLVGENMGPLAKNVIDPSMMTAWQVLEQMSEESTIFKQALGAQLQSANAPYSAIALLNQAGRLPLVTQQKNLSDEIGRAMQNVFEMAKVSGGVKVTGKSGVMDIKTAEIPDNIIIEATLDAKLPTDERQNAMMAIQLSSGDAPLLSQREAREDFLQVGQSDDMTKEILTEKVTMSLIQAKLAQFIQTRMPPPGAQPGQPGQQPPQQGQPPEQMPPQGQPNPQDMANLPPEVLAQMQGQAGAGMPAEPMSGPQNMGMPQQAGPGGM
jgi:hypothetical protein